MFPKQGREKYVKTATEIVADHRNAVDAGSSEIIAMKEIDIDLGNKFFKILIPESYETDLRMGRIFVGHQVIHLPKSAKLSIDAFTQGYDKKIRAEARAAGIYEIIQPFKKNSMKCMEQQCGFALEYAQATEKVVSMLLNGRCVQTDKFNLSIPPSPTPARDQATHPKTR